MTPKHKQIAHVMLSSGWFIGSLNTNALDMTSYFKLTLPKKDITMIVKVPYENSYDALHDIMYKQFPELFI